MIDLLWQQKRCSSAELLRLPMEGFTPWSRKSRSYTFSMTFERDFVESYFAMRKFSIERDEMITAPVFKQRTVFFTTACSIRILAGRAVYRAERRGDDL